MKVLREASVFYTRQVMFVSICFLVFLFIMFVSVTMFSPTSHAVTSVPLKMNYQGRLTNSSGTVLPNGTYNMKLRLYSANTGGTLLWSEDRLVSASTGVTVTNGLFSIRLGDVTTLPASLFNNQSNPTLYLETELPTPATATSNSPTWAEGPMTPRNQMATSAYAFNSDTLDGLDSDAFAQVGGNNTFTGTNTFKTATNSATGFSIQDSSGSSLLIADTTNDRIYIGQPTADANTTFLAVDSYNGGLSDPAGGFNGSIYYNTTSGKFRCFESGIWQNCSASPQNSSSTATQSLTAGSDIYLNGSTINIPTSGLQGPTGTSQDGTLIAWRVFMSKTAAGTAGTTFTIRFGTAGTTADTARCSTFSTGTGTAALDSAVVIITAYATAGGSGTTLNCSATMTHNQATTGFSTSPQILQSYSTQSTGFATNISNFKAGLSASAGTSTVITVNKVEATATNL